MNMTLFLETERLLLKKIEQADFDNIFKLRTDPEVMQYIGNNKQQTAEEVQRIIDEMLAHQNKHGYSMCSVFEKETGTFIGQAGLFHVGFYDQQPEIELGYRLNREYWGKGYGTELAKVLIKWGFEHLTINKIVAFVHPDNIASHRILENCGMINLGIQNCYYGNFIKFEIHRNDSIELVSHRAEWRHLAKKEIDMLCHILPTQHILDIQHVGSTAIPGIQSKPIIDIQIAVDSLIAIKNIAVSELKKLGYEYWENNPDKERMFFVKGMPPFGEKRTHHVHIVEPASPHWQGKTQFRDYLLSHPEAAYEYEALKVQLANKYAYDREKYTDAKTQFITDILKKTSSTPSDKKYPFVIFITGASGVGKTTLVDILNNSFHKPSIAYLHFDSIGVPSVENMTNVYGSPSEWQKAMTYHWVNKIIQRYHDKDLVIIEGQVNIDCIINAFIGFNIRQYKILLLHCDTKSRHKRLNVDRNQPELINDNMDAWADFLKNQALSKNAKIFDTTLMNENEMANVIIEYISNVNIFIKKNNVIPVRRTSRAVILNKDNHVLLLKIIGSPLNLLKYDDIKSFWITVRGECEESETHEMALQREIAEEVGISGPCKTELLAFGEHTLLWNGAHTKFIEMFYVIYVDDINLSNQNLTHEESTIIGEYRWWSVSEMLTTKDIIFPVCLPKLINDYINHSNNWIARKIFLD